MKCTVCGRRFNPGTLEGGCRCKPAQKMKQIEMGQPKHVGKPDRRARKAQRKRTAELAGITAILGLTGSQSGERGESLRIR